MQWMESLSSEWYATSSAAELRRSVAISGGASAVKQPGHFEVRQSFSQVTRMHFFLKNIDDPF